MSGGRGMTLNIKNLKNNIGYELKSCRHLVCATLKDTSKATNVSLSFICDIENGRTLPSIKTLIKLLRYYNVGLSDFMKDIECGV